MHRCIHIEKYRRRRRRRLAHVWSINWSVFYFSLFDSNRLRRFLFLSLLFFCSNTCMSTSIHMKKKSEYISRNGSFFSLLALNFFFLLSVSLSFFLLHTNVMIASAEKCMCRSEEEQRRTREGEKRERRRERKFIKLVVPDRFFLF